MLADRNEDTDWRKNKPNPECLGEIRECYGLFCSDMCKFTVMCVRKNIADNWGSIAKGV